MLKITIPARRAPAGRACAALVLLGWALQGCDDSTRIIVTGPADFTIAGEVSGLDDGTAVVLNNNGGDALTISANGAFVFPARVARDGAYSVTVATQPAGATCTVANGSGAGVTQDVSGVSVVCSALTYTISGTLSGLAGGAEVALRNNGADELTLATDGPFSFATPVAHDGSYSVTVTAQPAGATCTVSDGSGSGVTADVADVSVNCSTNTYEIGGAVTGLGDGLQVTLLNNAADPLTILANGNFAFATRVSDQGSYNVTVGTQPIGQTCTVMNGQGANLAGNIADVSVACSTDAFTIGGTLAGLAPGVQVTLNNNAADPLTVVSNGAFTFAIPVVSGGTYAVTVGTQPGGQFCTVSGGTGANVAADVDDVAVECIESSVAFTTPGSHAYTVPAGVTSIEVAVTGGGGGGGGLWGVGLGQTGGAGAVVVATLTVTPGQELDLVVGGGGGDGADGPPEPGGGGGYTCGAGGGGGGSSNVDAGTPAQVVAGGGGGGGSCNNATAGGSGSANGDGAGGDGASTGPFATGGSGGSDGLGGAGGQGFFGLPAQGGADGDGGAGGEGGNNSGAYPGGPGGSSAGAGIGGGATSLSGGGGGGYGGGGAGSFSTGGGAGGSSGPVGSAYAPGTNGGASSTPGGDGSIVITILQ